MYKLGKLSELRLGETLDKNPIREAIKRAKNLTDFMENEFNDNYEIECIVGELEFGIRHIGKGSLKVKMRKKGKQNTKVIVAEPQERIGIPKGKKILA